MVIGIGLVYAFSALGDSPVLSAALSEAVDGPYLGAAFGLRSLLGDGHTVFLALAGWVLFGRHIGLGGSPNYRQFRIDFYLCQCGIKKM